MFFEPVPMRPIHTQINYLIKLTSMLMVRLISQLKTFFRPIKHITLKRQNEHTQQQEPSSCTIHL